MQVLDKNGALVKTIAQLPSSEGEVLSQKFIEEFRKKSLLGACWIGDDAILAPTTPSAAFPIDSSKEVSKSDPVKMYLNDVFTIPANLAGLPAMSVPAGFDKDGLPLGLQIMANHFDEQTMFDVALALEEEIGSAK